MVRRSLTVVLTVRTSCPRMVNSLPGRLGSLGLMVATSNAGSALAAMRAQLPFIGSIHRADDHFYIRTILGERRCGDGLAALIDIGVKRGLQLVVIERDFNYRAQRLALRGL